MSSEGQSRGRFFAFGQDRLRIPDDLWRDMPEPREECNCPAIEAGVSPTTCAAGVYDRVLKERTGKMLGVVDEETAKAAWTEALRRVRYSTNGFDAAPQTRAVMKALGWEVPDDVA